MRLAAVFIEDVNSDNGGYTLNLGGYYHYSIKIHNNICYIESTVNSNYIENFFDKNSTILNISAIVGKNGSGKTTLIRDTINTIKSNPAQGFTILEDSNKVRYINNYPYSRTKIITIDSSGFEQSEIFMDSIYYTPHLDHKQGVSNIDLSADKFLSEDLKNIDSTFDANKKIIIEERLKKFNYKRFIEFQKSKYSKSIADNYGLLMDDYIRVTFTRHKISIERDSNGEMSINFHNTPYDFREFLDYLFLEIREEYDNYGRSVENDNERFELQKKLMKNFILMDLFCLLISLMEQTNEHLEEGHFLKEEKYEEEIIDLNAEQKFRYWLRNYRYSRGNKNPLPGNEVLNILDFLYNYIDNAKFDDDYKLFSWDTQSLFFVEKNIDQLLKLNQDLILALPKYYSSNQENNQDIYTDLSHLQVFVNLEFSSRNLSSGESAMLNLYSRIFDFFNKNILKTKIRSKNDYYILFLDEADLGYHPEWKRTYILNIIDFCKSFFKDVKSKVQVIFSTHDPISLSDIPNYNITYLKTHKNNFYNLLMQDSTERPSKSFAANITDLLSDSFFLHNGLVGDFAKTKIKEVIDNLNYIILKTEIEILKENNDKNEKDILDYKLKEFNLLEKNVKIKDSGYLKSVIDIIDEPLLKFKLNEMYFQAFPTEVEKDDAIKRAKQILGDAGLDIEDLNESEP